MRKSLSALASLAVIGAGMSLAHGVSAESMYGTRPAPRPPTRRERMVGAVVRFMRRRTPLRTSWRNQSPERLAAAQDKRAWRCARNLRNWRGFCRMEALGATGGDAVSLLP